MVNINSQSHKKLNLGCGEDKKPGYVNIDWQASVDPDVVHDLNSLPYPFIDNSFDLVEANHVLEHLDKPFNIMREFHRILKPGGNLIIKVPHFSRGFTHAEHCHGFDVTFPFYFNKDYTKSGFIGAEFQLTYMRLRWMAFFNLLKNMGYNPIIIGLLKIPNAVITFLANISPSFCSRVWCFWVGGFEEIEYRFRAKK